MELLMIIKDFVLSVVMAGFLAYIAYQQLETNRKKLTLDLYNKRFEVYSVALEFYQELTSHGASTKLVRKFIEKKEAAQFLFSEDPSIYSLLNEMHAQSFKINAVINNQSTHEYNSPELRGKLTQDSLDAANWFDPAVKRLSKKMEIFLKI